MVEEHILSLPFKSFFDSAATGVALADPRGNILVVNPTFMRLIGRRPEEVSGRNILNFIAPEKIRDVRDMLDGLATDSHQRYKSDVVLSHSQGHALRALFGAALVQDPAGTPLCMMFTVSEIPVDQPADEAATRASTPARYIDKTCLKILDVIPQILLFISQARHIEGINKQGESAFGYARQELISCPVETLFPDLTWQTPVPDAAHHAVRPLFAVHALHKNGERIPVLLDLRAVHAGDKTYWLGIVQHLTGHKTAGDANVSTVSRDPVTGLYTRSMFLERLQHAASRAERDEKKLGVLLLDLDRFKEINDSFGHEGGDELLKEVGERIAAFLRKSDTVARLDGDHFAILLEGLKKSEHALATAQKLLGAFAAPFLRQEQDVYLSPSIGISIFPEDGLDGDSLIRNAQNAMRMAKKSGGNAFQFYTGEMNTRAIERIRLDSELRRALKHGQFAVYYQPLVNATDGRAVCLEALLRWNHPEKGLVPPMSFIPLLEETGLIEQVGDLVLRAACQQLKALRHNGHGRLRVAVNISARQFLQKDFAATVEKILKETGADPRALELEITESVLLRNTENVGRILASIVALGVRIILDDFGTGCSSLSYLKHFPIHALKIDRNFVQGLPRQRGDLAITNAIITLATDLGLKVIAEGVETDEQHAYLREQQCHELQGFLFSRPMPAEEVGPWLNKQLH